jgi:hypothetical protein
VPNSTTRACPTMASRRYLLQGWPLRTGPCSSGDLAQKCRSQSTSEQLEIRPLLPAAGFDRGFHPACGNAC